MTRPKRGDVPGTPEAETSRTRILAAAAEIAAEAGYEGTTIAAVTSRSGLPVSSVYWFFRDKDHLLADVVRHSFAEWAARLPRWELPASSLRDALGANLHQSLSSLLAAPDFLRIGQSLTLLNRATPPAGRILYLEIRASVEDGLTGWFEAALDAAVTQDDPALPRTLARFVLAASDGFSLALRLDAVTDQDALVDLVVAAVGAAVDGARNRSHPASTRGGIG